MAKRKDLIGQRFNKLLVIDEGKKKSFNTAMVWKCLCDCGNIVEIVGQKLRSNHTKSCGCIKGKFKRTLIDLTGKIFDKLTVLNQNFKNQSNNKYTRYWNCLCECGKSLVVNEKLLKNKTKKSCGCDINKIIKPIKVKNDLIGKLFGRLTVIERSQDITLSVKKETIRVTRRATWKCLCNCGNNVIVTTIALVTGNTKSCGCLHTESSRKNIAISHLKQIKYQDNPILFSARSIWGATYKEPGGISFEDFYNLSQQKCFYCGSVPYISFNAYIENQKKGLQSYLTDIKLGEFKYNGLDRINSNFGHVLENVIPCCVICNRTKSKYSLHNFKQYIERIINYQSISVDEHRKLSSQINFEQINQFHNSYKVTVKCIYSDYYKCANLTLEQFYQLSQLNCYYCNLNSLHSNKQNKYQYKEYLYFYNGLDRIDSSMDHSFTNVVACCKQCNWGKNKLSIIEYTNWINKLKNNYSNFLELYNNLIKERHEWI